MMALLANCNRDPRKGRALRPEDFDPYADREPAVFDKTTAAELRRALGGLQRRPKT